MVGHTSGGGGGVSSSVSSSVGSSVGSVGGVVVVGVVGVVGVGVGVGVVGSGAVSGTHRVSVLPKAEVLVCSFSQPTKSSSSVDPVSVHGPHVSTLTDTLAVP